MNRDIIIRVVSGSTTTDLDINSNIPLRLNISSLENSKIGRVFGVGSQAFDLPGTPKNNKFFKNANDIGSMDTPAIYEFLQAYLLMDGDTLIQGKFFLKEIICSDDGYITYKCQIVDQTIDFKTQLDGKFISEADWSDFEHTMSAETIVDGFDGTLLDGDVFYPLAVYGTDESIPFPLLPRIQVGDGQSEALGNIDCSGSRMGLQQFQPAVSAVGTFDVMFAQAGYNYVSTLVTSSASATTPFNNLFVMPKSNEELGPVVSGSINNTLVADYTASRVMPLVPANTYTEYSASFHGELSDPGNNYNINTAEYTMPTGGQYTISGQIRFTNPVNQVGGKTIVVSVGLKLFTPAGVLANIIQLGQRQFSQFTALGATVGGTRTFEGFEGYKLRTYVSLYNYSPSRDGIAYQQVAGNDTFLNMTVAPFKYSGVTVLMNEQWNGDTKTSDVLKGFIEQFNLVLVPEYDTERTIRVETFDTWMLQGRNIDWTQKYDQSKRISITHPISEQNKELQISNAEDADRFSKLAKENEPNLQYGTIQIVADSEIPLGKREIKSYFAPTIVGSLILSGSVTEEGQPTLNLSGNNIFVPHLYKSNGSKQQTFAFKPRLGYKLDDLSPSAAFNDQFYFGDLGGTLFSSSIYSTLANISSLDLTDDIFNLHFDSQYPDYTAIGGPYQLAEAQAQTAYNTYWNNYIQGLYWDEARKVTLSLQFTPEEYKDIRLNDTIVIKNQRFRINKISGFNITYPDVATVELLKEFPVYNNVTDYLATVPKTYYVLNRCSDGASVGTAVETGSLFYLNPPTGDTLPINTRVSGSNPGGGAVYTISGYSKTNGSITQLTDFTPREFGCPLGSTNQSITIQVNAPGDGIRLVGTDSAANPIDQRILNSGSMTFCMQRDDYYIQLSGDTATYIDGGSC